MILPTVAYILVTLLAASRIRAADYEVQIEKDVRSPMRDSVRLAADIYRPRADGTFPVMVLRTAYGKQNSNSTGMAKRGYIVVVQDTRGRGGSEGIFDPFFDDERDGYDTVEWAAALRQSNGKVGMFGSSYSGATQVFAAMASPPHLAAIFPVFPAISFGPHGNLFEGGAFRQLLAESWSAAQTVEHYPKAIGRLAADREYFSKLMSELPVGSFMDAILREFLSRGGGGYFREWVGHAPGSEYWRRIDVAGKVSNIKVPSCLIGGWFDIFGPGTAGLFQALQREGGTETARSGSQLIMGPWTHGGSKFPSGDADFGASAGISFGSWQNKWFDYWLKGERNEVATQPQARVFLMGANRWLKLPRWPPAGAIHRLYLAAGGKLVQNAPEPGKEVLKSDPADPVPTNGGKLCCHAGFAAGTFDQSATARRPDVLSYSSGPLEGALAIAGDVVLHLSISPDTPDADVVAKLIDVTPEGKALPVADGVLRLRYRNGLAKAEPMKRGSRYDVRVDVGPVANTFPAGHRIRVQLAGSDFPNYSRNLNSGEELAVASRPRVANTTIFFGARRSSWLEMSRMAGSR